MNDMHEDDEKISKQSCKDETIHRLGMSESLCLSFDVSNCLHESGVCWSRLNIDILFTPIYPLAAHAMSKSSKHGSGEFEL